LARGIDFAVTMSGGTTLIISNTISCNAGTQNGVLGAHDAYLTGSKENTFYYGYQDGEHDPITNCNYNIYFTNVTGTNTSFVVTQAYI
jgi:hypothetical protein